MSENVPEPAASYLRTWTVLLNHLLGWDEVRTRAWAESWSGLYDPESLFYHESPVYYAVPLLVPDDLKKQLSLRELELLCTELRASLESCNLYRELEHVDWPDAKRQIENILSRYRPSEGQRE